MEYDDFQDAVVALARDGARLTKGSVALRLKIDPASAGAMLDRMTRDGRLDLDLDERTGEILYVMRREAGRPPKAAGETALARIGRAIDADDLAVKVGGALAKAKIESAGVALPPEKRRKLGVGVVLGGLLPGVGLAYSAPWPVVVAASAIVLVGVKIIGIIPLLSAFLLIPFIAVCAIASAVLGGLYTWQYNQTGKRTPLGDDPVSPRRILKLLRR